MLISVVIPTYKRPDRLIRAIESVLKQTYEHLQLIIVDDNDPLDRYRSETEELVKVFANDESVLYLKHPENRGGAEARNTGIRHADGEFIAFLDDDDEWLSDKLQKQIDALLKMNEKERNQIGVIYCKEKVIDGPNVYFRNSAVSKDPLRSQILQTVATTSSLMINKKAIVEVGGFKNLPSSQEGELLLRIFSKGYGVCFVDDVLVIRHLHQKERISARKRRRDNIWFEVRKEYLQYLSKKEKKVFYRYHFLSEFRYDIREKSYLSAARHLNKAWLQAPFHPICYVNLLAFILSADQMNRVRSIFHKTKENIFL